MSLGVRYGESTVSSDDISFICAGRSFPAVAGRVLPAPSTTFTLGLQHFSSPAEQEEGCRAAFVT